METSRLVDEEQKATRSDICLHTHACTHCSSTSSGPSAMREAREKQWRHSYLSALQNGDTSPCTDENVIVKWAVKRLCKWQCVSPALFGPVSDKLSETASWKHEMTSRCLWMMPLYLFYGLLITGTLCTFIFQGKQQRFKDADSKNKMLILSFRLVCHHKLLCSTK